MNRNQSRSKEDVAQPPPAVTTGNLQAFYRRSLPHLQVKGRSYFVTFATWKRWELPMEIRGLVMNHILYDHNQEHILHGAVVMPDHVHIVFTPLVDQNGMIYGLSEILGGIKGASSHSINRFLKRRGHVWQDESFDHLLRSSESIRDKVEYICQNPVRKRLVDRVDDYRWLWREWVEGECPDTAGGGCATNGGSQKGNGPE